MKYLLLAVGIGFCSTLFSQTASSVSLDSLTLTTRNVQDGSDLLPLSPTDPDYKEPKVEVTIQFIIAHIEQLKNIEISFEKEKGKKDFKTFDLAYTVANGKSYLTIKDKFYEIVNAKVTINQEMPAKLLSRKIYFSVKGIDKNKNQSNVLTREFN